MLTNDDGYEAPGLAAVRGALEAAGFDVTCLVAPLRQQSGSGARITLGEMAVVAHDRATWSVGRQSGQRRLRTDRGAQAARAGRGRVGRQSGPEPRRQCRRLRTVGAAVMAAQLGVPAIAVSVGLDMAQAKAQPTPLTVAAHPLAADFVARLDYAPGGGCRRRPSVARQHSPQHQRAGAPRRAD